MTFSIITEWAWFIANGVTGWSYLYIAFEIWRWHWAMPLRAVRIYCKMFASFIALSGVSRLEILWWPVSPFWWSTWIIRMPLMVLSVATVIVLVTHHQAVTQALRDLYRVYRSRDE